MKQSKRLLSLLLSASLATGMLPAVALADEVDDTQIISVDEEQIAEDVAEASESQDAIVVEDGSEDAAEAESEETEETVVDSEESVAIDVAATEAEAAEKYVYVMMNVPYTVFWSAYDTTDIAFNVNATSGKTYSSKSAEADAVTTATTSKFLGTTGLAGGTYNDGKYIRGVYLPVAVKAGDLADFKEAAIVKGQYEGEAYDYVTLDKAPAAYSTLTVNEDGSYSFSKLQNTTLNHVALGFADGLDGFTTSSYGDYEICITGIEPSNGGIKLTDGSYLKPTIYGVILNITDKDNQTHRLGMTQLENMWYGGQKSNFELAWSIKNGNQLHLAHNNSEAPLYYQFDTNGGTLTGATLITDYGIIEVNDTKELPSYYEGDLSALTLSIANDSKVLNISGLPNDLENTTVTVSSNLADKATIQNDQVALSAYPVDGTNYTVTISSDNYPDITRKVSTIISQAQKDELQRWVNKAKAIQNPSNESRLNEHIDEAVTMINAGTATSYEAAELIGELTELVKENYSSLSLSATLKGSVLSIDLGNVAISDLENATYKLTSGEGRGARTLASGSLSALSFTLAKAPTIGTEYTLTIVSDNYKDSAVKVTAAKVDQSVTVSKDSISMTYGDKAVALGASAKTALTYESSDKNVATVDANGNVTAVGAGTATITIKAAASDTIAEASKTVTVTVAAAAQTISGTSSYSKTYSTTAFSLDAKTNGNGKLTYASSNTAVATVDAAGKVTLKGKGTATITVKAAATSQYKEASKTVTVTVSAASQTITTGSASYSKKYGNAAFSLGAKTSGNGALTYTSSKSSVATVSSAGKVTIKGIGTTTITIKAAATNQYNAASKTVKVTVAKGTSTITAKSYTKAYGAKAFKLGAKNSGNGKLTYTSSNKKVATVSSAGKITVKGVGKATITIKAAGTTKYKAASKKVTITVNPAKTSISSLKNVKGKKMTVKWAKKSSATGYQIYYSTSSSFKTYKKTTSTSASKTISKLTKGKTYYVKVRGYKKVSGKTYYASWSTSKKVKITK